MIANDLTLNPGSYGGTAANLVFVLGGYPSPTSSIRRVQATALTEPNSLLISHQTVKRSSVEYARRMIRRDRSLIDPILGTIKGSVWLATDIPLGTSVFTGAVVKDMIGHLASTWMTAGVTDAFLAGEM
jgi:hypothetical protein